MLRLSLAFSLVALVAMACGDDDRPPRDAGGLPDAPRTDAPPPPPTDGGPDSGGTDAGGSGMCPAGACDILAQNCTTAGEGCYLNGPDPVCAPAGTAGDGATCMNANDCQEGFGCQGGVCRHFCCGMSDTGCPLGQTCAIQLVDEMGDPLGVGVCRLPDTCDPLEQTGCTGMDGCYINGGDGSVICIPSTMDLAEGADCGMTANACTPGLICIPSDGASACRAFCDMVDMDPACPMGRMCASLGIASQPSWGVCVPSM